MLCFQACGRLGLESCCNIRRLKLKRYFVLCSLLAAPVLAQTQIGGGTCSSSSLNGTYAVSISGRQVSNAGNFATVFQAIGAATFDGQSAINIVLTEDTNQVAGMA